jgi:hypothetical protein
MQTVFRSSVIAAVTGNWFRHRIVTIPQRPARELASTVLRGDSVITDRQMYRSLSHRWLSPGRDHVQQSGSPAALVQQVVSGPQ